MLLAHYLYSKLEGMFGFGSWGRLAIIKFPAKIMGRKYVFVGDHVFIAERSFISMVEADSSLRAAPKLVIGDRTRIGFDLHISCMGNVTIESDVMISGRVFIGDCEHGYKDITKPIVNQPMEHKGDVLIRSESFIGVNACVMPGITIGKHAVIGASAVVTKSVPDYCIAVGNPAKVIAKYSEESEKWEKI